MSFFGVQFFKYSKKRGEGATCGPAYNRGRALCAAPQLHTYPDDILTKAQCKHDVRLDPHIIAPDPYETTDQYIDVFGPENKDLLTPTEQLNTMSTADDDSSSGINGRLRPRKSYISSLQAIKTTRRLDAKSSQEKSKRVTTPSKALLNKPDDLSKKSDCTSVIDFLCPYCDKSFVSKQAVSKHARRIHFSTSKQDTFINCLFCNHTEAEPNNIVRHMIDSHPNQYFACLDCHTRFPSTAELAEHKLNVCERQKLPYRSKLRKKSSRANKKVQNIERQVVIREEDRHGYNGIVISCELKPTHVHDAADIEDNITTNLILPPGKNLANKVIDKNAVIVLDDLQWNKRISHNFSFHNTDADQILSRLGVVHRSPRTGETTRKDWFKAIDDASQKFERCFDTSFYTKVASNVQENLSKFLDGSFNFNPDPNHTIKTRKAKNSVQINTVEGFPILLSCEQYSRNLFDGYMPRAIAPKHKWKWENLENERNLFNADIIKRDSHINNCIVTLVSSLDIWTQLCMRRKFEEKFKITPIEKKTEKRNIIGKELKEILESRQLPTPTSSFISLPREAPVPVRDGLDFPASLGLTPTVPKYEIQPAILSGEWVRPRCYVCCACGAQTRDPRALSTHISTQHPNAHVQHYEIAGELLLNADILKHLYVPPSPVHNRTRPLRGFRECTKCNKSITLEDLHQHMLDCAGDMPAVRRRCRYRQFGVRKRRNRIPDNRIRKKIRKEIQRQHGRPRPKIRTEVGDAETIRKMLADLPAKRQRVMINPLNSALRPRKKIVKQRNQMTLKRRSTDDSKNRKTIASPESCEGERPENNDPNKINKIQEENRSLKTNIKRVQTQAPRRSEIMNKKTVTKTRRKTVRVTQKTETVEKDVTNPPTETSNIQVHTNNVQVEQLSIENSPDKVDVNSGPYNIREQANRSNSDGSRSNNNGSNNRDNQNTDRNDHNGNSRDQGAPPQNIPLKHSIARLTADYDTQDKAVQFHHLFLVQQECNNVTQHVPSGQPVLFENKTIATKLDKPPLNVSHKDELMDNHNAQKGKSSKPRKGLNDCIAMLKNKLVEPIDQPISTAPNVSIQCRMDEPSKLLIEDVKKTTINSNRIDITVQCPDTDNLSTDTVITPRRRQSINAEKSIEEQIANLPSIGEYIKQNPELLLKHKVYESLNCNQSVELLNQISSSKASTSLKYPQTKQLTDVPPGTMKMSKSSKHQIRESTEGKSDTSKQLPKDSYKELYKYNEIEHTKHQTTHHVSKPDKLSESATSLKNKCAKSTSSIHHDNISEKMSNYDKHSNVAAVTKLHINQDTNLINQDMNQKIPDINQLPDDQTQVKKNDTADIIPPAHCNLGLGSVITAPLDLSGKQYSNAVIAHCSKQNYTYDSRTCENYETLDLSNKVVMSQDNHTTSLTFNDEVVDLRVKHITTTQTADSSLYSETIGGNISNNTATDLSIRNPDIDCAPTDLSFKGKTKPSSICAIRKEDIHTESLYSTDIPVSHKDINMLCLNLSAKDTEVPTDLSTKNSSKNVLSVRIPTEPSFYHDIRPQSTENDKNKLRNPADLSCREKTERQIGILDKNNVTILQCETINKNDPNKNTRKVASSSTSLKSTNMESPMYETQNVKLNTNSTEVMQKHPYVKGDITISLANKHISKSANVHNNLDSPRNTEVNNINRAIYALPNTQSLAVNNSQEYSHTGYSMNPVIPSTRNNNNNESSILAPTIPTVNKTTTNSDIGLVSSSKSMNEVTANASVYSTMSESQNVMSQSMPLIPSTSYKDTQKSLDNNVPGYKNKCAQKGELVKNTETNDKIKTASLDNDPETAKKIAMLPKELVEILGNMPIDHRNQLLNVLPQYVSTSTSPTPNIKIQGDDFKGDPNISQYPYLGLHKSQQRVGDEFQLPHSAVNYMTSHNTKKSIGLVDGTHTVVAAEQNEHIKNETIIKKRLNDSIIIEDRIIDLTDDVAETCENSSQNKENKNVCVTFKSVANKTNNEKTASLRAVRIKAPSERQKSLITETQLRKTYQENNNTIKLDTPDKNYKDTLGPLAVQQFEISTTDEAKTTDKSCNSQLKNKKGNVNSNSSESMISELNVTPDDDNTMKSCCTSSTMVENVKIVNTMTSAPPDITPSNSTIAEKHEFSQIQSPLITADIKLKSLHESEAELTINIPKGENVEKDIYEDDSEDDVSLAIIVKQKLKDQELQSIEIKDNDMMVTSKLDAQKNIDHKENNQNNSSVTDLDLNKILNRSDVGYAVENEEIKEKHSKERKIKRSRRNMNTCVSKIIDENKYEYDVNKENSVCSDGTKETKRHEDEQKCLDSNHVKLKPTDFDEITIIDDSRDTNDLKDKTDLPKDTNLPYSENTVQQIDDGNSNVLENDTKLRKNIRCKLNTEDLICASKTVVTVENIESQTKSKKISQNNLESKSSEKIYTNVTIELEGSVICSEIQKEENELHSDTKCVNIHQINNTLSVKISSSQKDKLITPLRRSRRGKSLFVENIDISPENKDQSESGVDLKAPITKKQLIFSKLLLDGEKSVNEITNTGNDTVVDEDHRKNDNDTMSTSIPNKSVSSDSINITSISKSHKRKQSSITKSKLKRKKSLEKIEMASNDLERNQDIKNKESLSPSTTVDAENVSLDDEPIEKSEDTIKITETHSKLLTFKRKSNNFSNADALPSSTSKKLKSNIDSGKNESHPTEEKKNTKDIKERINEEGIVKSEIKPAARRGRSKSVFVKSSTSEIYDPYDITLEDMIPQKEPFIKKTSVLKNSTGKKQNKNCSIAQAETDVENDAPCTTTAENNNINSNKITDTNIQDEAVVETKNVMSDSDDSSKSDIPLKKYVQEKERKKFEVKARDKVIDEPNKAGLRKRNKQTLSVYSDKLEDGCRDENEERIRSEQFMESFGFFSERKPRKSNLLATKKISETFHSIANEKDDSFFISKEKSNYKKMTQFESRKSADDEGNVKESISSSNKKVSKRGRKKKISTKIEPSYCDVCRKEFHRPDNFLRHQMTLAHVTRVSESDSKVKSDPSTMDGSNYLVIYKRQLDRLRVLQDKITRRKKYCKSLEKIPLPTLEEIIADVTSTVKQQQLARRGLSRDEALFLDCCELLNASHKDDATGRIKPDQGCDNNCLTCSGTSIECLNLLEKRINKTLEGKCDDGDVDSITAQDILESEEVRILENDLISGLKEAACANTFNGNNASSTYTTDAAPEPEEHDKFITKDYELEQQTDETKSKKVVEIKEKMYPDVIENIDMFEDKFDKIKRKCRSQAAKQTQYVETSTSHKSRKKVDKKKRKKSPKKNLHSSVPTKGALKGFDGVKVSISTSEIDMSSILSTTGPHRKRKRNTSKRKRERSNSDVSRCESDDKNKEDSQSKLDVYEFMDNEDAELFEFRPSTLMERFKSIGNKDMPSTSKSQPAYNDQDGSSESGSDGDDFVYMSDDYVCSDAETENSLMSCDFGNVKGVPEAKKPSTPPKRKEIAEKNVVMGKIFKNNAVRTEKKVNKGKEPVKAKANLDQLFDSLLEEEPNSSLLFKNSPSPKHESFEEYNVHSPLTDEREKSRSKFESKSTNAKDDETQSFDESDAESLRKVTKTPSPVPYTTLVLSSKKRKSLTPPRKIRLSIDENRPSTSKTHEWKKSDKEKYHKKSAHRKKGDVYHDLEDSTPKRRNTYSPNYDDDSLLRIDEPHTDDSFSGNKRKSKEKEFKNKPMAKTTEKNISVEFNYSDDVFDNSDYAGVARQRARRKCTVGKQNVLAETWSSESEPDGIPPRPNSADSVVVGLGRKKKGRKKEGQALGGRKVNNRQVIGKKHEVEDIVPSNRNSCDTFSRVVPTTRPSAVGASNKKVRPRPPPYYWSDDEEEQEHVQQHGWIVGDSHKKLVTMLAHAKGKRNNDDKRHLVE